MFYVAEALLFEKGLQFRKHSGVHSAFGEHFAKAGCSIPNSIGGSSMRATRGFRPTMAWSRSSPGRTLSSFLNRRGSFYVRLDDF
jgi:uncharacterized protein (UPF0332 family)